MSHIPSNAMPHAGPAFEPEQGETMTLSQRASKLADIARENPKTTVAAGAALFAGAIAAAAIPIVRSRKASSKSAPATPRKKPARKTGPSSS